MWSDNNKTDMNKQDIIDTNWLRFEFEILVFVSVLLKPWGLITQPS